MAIPLPLPPSGTPYVDPVTGLVSLQWQNYFLAFQLALGPNLPPVDAQYWLSTSNGVLTNERNIGALATGYLKVATVLGVATPSTTTTIPAADLSGTIPDAAFPATLPAVSGANLTTLNAGNLTSGTVNPARLPTLSMFALLWNTAAVVGATTTYVGPLGANATETSSRVVVPVASVLQNLYVIADGAPGVGQTFTYTLRINGVDTAVTATISGAATTAHDLTHSAAVVAGDTVDIKLVTSALAAAQSHATGVEGATTA